MIVSLLTLYPIKRHSISKDLFAGKFFNRYEPSSPDAVATEDPVNKMVAPNTGSPVSLSNTLPEIVCATDAVEENRKKTITKKESFNVILFIILALFFLRCKYPTRKLQAQCNKATFIL